MAKTFYDVLGVSKDASQDEIKSAYRKLARQYHPDVNQGNEEAANKFKEISEAYDTLGNPEKRKGYDNPASQFGFGGGGGGFDFGFGGGGGGSFFDDFINIFSGGGGRETRQRMNRDISMNISLTFEEAAFGTKKNISFNRTDTCSDCKGTGAKNGTAQSVCEKCGGNGKVRVAQNTPFGSMVSTKTCSHCGGTGRIIKEACDTCGGKGSVRKNVKLTVTFPSGIDNGQIVTVAGEGENNYANIKPGNLMLIVNVQPHKLFTRKGLDLLLEIPVSFTQAILGEKIMVPTLTDKKISFAIPEGAQNGSTFKISGQGIESKRGTGNMLITISIEMPKSISKEQRKLLQQLGETMKSDQFEQLKKFNKKV